MNNLFAKGHPYVMALGCVMAIQGAWAATQTTPYIAIHSQPLYANLAAMPYANAKAPKGGYLSTASNGTFDTLTSMNGKGSSADGVNYLFDSLMSSS